MSFLDDRVAAGWRCVMMRMTVMLMVVVVRVTRTENRFWWFLS